MDEEYIFRLPSPIEVGDGRRLAMRVDDFLEEDPIANSHDVPGNLRKYQKARAKTILEMFEDYTYVGQNMREDVESKIRSLDKNLAAREPGGAAWEQKERKHPRELQYIAESIRSEIDELRTVKTFVALMRSQREGSVSPLISNKPFQMMIDLDKYFDTTPVDTNTSGYTEVEKAVGAPAGYYELLDFLTGYKRGYRHKRKREDGTEEETHESSTEYFQRLQRFLPPTKLAAFLSFSLSRGETTSTDISAVLTQIRDRIRERSTFTFRDVRRALHHTIESLYNETQRLN